MCLELNKEDGTSLPLLISPFLQITDPNQGKNYLFLLNDEKTTYVKNQRIIFNL
jgi:hypothetical protein